MSFEEFWSVYPKKAEKIYARQCYLKAVKNGATEAELLIGAKNYLKHVQSENTELRFIKNPSTFLNRGCWEDCYETPKPSQTESQDPVETLWKPRIRLFHSNGYWSQNWGPKPSEEGCMAPDSLLTSNIVEFKKLAS